MNKGGHILIFYFSATGNGLFIAKTISKMTGETVRNITDFVKNQYDIEIGSNEKIGIISPVYFYGLPIIVEEFINMIAPKIRNEIYIILNYGTFPGQAMARAEEIMAKANLRVHSKMTVRMPENYTLLFNPPGSEECEMIIDKAAKRIETFAEHLMNDEPTDMCEKPKVLHRALGSIARPIYDLGRGTGRFYVNTDCIKCGKCVKMCPSDAIEMIDRTPTWVKKKCLRCCACINRCPHRAIEFGLLTKNKRRYVNPYVEFDDMSKR